MQLSLRLKAIADMVSEGNRLVDVGCDHGYLPVYLVLNKKIPSAIAADVRTGPLSKAKEHIEKYSLNDYIQTRLSDGLSNIEKGEGETLVVAGMGGPLMERILMEGKEVREGFKEMILQPQSEIPHFRKFVFEQGWEIIQENIIEEDGKFYPMMKVIKSKNILNKYSVEQLYAGVNLIEEAVPTLIRFLNREKTIRIEVIDKLKMSNSESAKIRLKEVEEEMYIIDGALNIYAGN